jgi:hypothetical protein
VSESLCATTCEVLFNLNCYHQQGPPQKLEKRLYHLLKVCFLNICATHQDIGSRWVVLNPHLLTTMSLHEPLFMALSQELAYLQKAASVVPLLVVAGCSSLEVDKQGFTAVEHALLAQDVQSVYALYCAGSLFTKQQLLMMAILVRASSPTECALFHCLPALCEPM